MGVIPEALSYAGTSGQLFSHSEDEMNVGLNKMVLKLCYNNLGIFGSQFHKSIKESFKNEFIGFRVFL